MNIQALLFGADLVEGETPNPNPNGLINPNPKPNEPTKDETYKISILQSPSKARMCGINTPLGKRILDPALVVAIDVPQPRQQLPQQQQIIPPVNTREKTDVEIDQELKDEIVCLVSICDKESPASHAISKSVKALYARDGTYNTRMADLLVGQTVKTPQNLSIGGGIRKHVFVFSDLSVRLSGTFRLKCTCINITT